MKGLKRYGVERRDFLKYMAAVSAIPFAACRTTGLIVERPRFADYPFKLNVASGDPEPDGVVLWTRLAPKPLEGGGMPAEPVRTRWEVATDEAFTNIVRQGTALALPQLGHSVHVEVTGLKPHHWYFYRFHAGNETSPIGRTRTATVIELACSAAWILLSPSPSRLPPGATSRHPSPTSNRPPAPEREVSSAPRCDAPGRLEGG